MKERKPANGITTASTLRIAFDLARDLITYQSPTDIARMKARKEKRDARRAKIKTLVTFPKRPR